MLGSLLPMPSAGTLFGNTTSSDTEIVDYAGGFFNDWLPLMWLAVGVFVAAIGVLYVRRVINRGAGRVLGGGRRGGRRRRR